MLYSIEFVYHEFTVSNSKQDFAGAALVEWKADQSDRTMSLQVAK